EMLNFKLEDNGGGIGKVSIKLNGKEVVEDITKTEIYNLETNTFEFLLSHPFIRPESLNKLSVEAFNDKGYPLSNQKNIYFIPEKRENTAPVPSKLFVLSIGISDYRGKAIDLNYAAKDATDFADAMEIAGVAQFGEDNFELFRMTTDTNQKGTYPLKENISSTFKEIANQANPEDIFMVYFAGHGLDLENDDEFYFLTAEAEHPYVRGPEEARGISLSSSELAELFKLVPSQKQVLVVDACHSGNLANGLFSENGQLKTEGIRALDKVKDRTGLYILASSEGAEVSYESSHLEQGLLTYSLLFGLKGEALQDNEYVDVIDMLQYARKKVPELADEIGERQIPIVQIPQDASSFYLGRLGTAEKGKIKINSAKPIVLSSSFQNEETLLDEQHAGLKMDEIIKNDRSKYNNQYLFIEQGGVFSNAYSIYGRYRKEGNGYVVDYRIFNGEKELKKGSLSDQNLEDLLNVIADELIKLIIDN
ncbi:MAG: caspase family protein, partial [Cyclobacteriaceae bacterium]|nr:caspase family protein [Cyclobacteriaceae bacterium]